MMENVVSGVIPIIDDESEIIKISYHLLSQGYFPIAYIKGVKYIEARGIIIPQSERKKIKGSIITICYLKLYTDDSRETN